MSHKAQLTEQDIIFDIEDNETVLEAALRQGYNLPYCCCNGLCGTCKAKVVSGNITYTDNLHGCLTEKERRQGYALLCQAKAYSDLSIEVRTIGTTDDLELKQLACRSTTCEKLNKDVVIDNEINEIVLEAASDQEHNLPYGYRVGLCGSCNINVVSNNTDDADNFPEGLSEKILD